MSMSKWISVVVVALIVAGVSFQHTGEAPWMPKTWCGLKIVVACHLLTAALWGHYRAATATGRCEGRRLRSALLFALDYAFEFGWVLSPFVVPSVLLATPLYDISAVACLMIFLITIILIGITWEMSSCEARAVKQMLLIVDETTVGVMATFTIMASAGVVG